MFTLTIALWMIGHNFIKLWEMKLTKCNCMIYQKTITGKNIYHILTNNHSVYVAFFQMMVKSVIKCLIRALDRVSTYLRVNNGE